MNLALVLAGFKSAYFLSIKRKYHYTIFLFKNNNIAHKLENIQFSTEVYTLVLFQKL